jgi:hypothetical protein
MGTVTGLWSMPVRYDRCTTAINHIIHDAALNADVAAIAPALATLGIGPDADGDGDAPEGQGQGQGQGQGRVPVAHGNDRLGGLDEDGMCAGQARPRGIECIDSVPVFIAMPPACRL